MKKSKAVLCAAWGVLLIFGSIGCRVDSSRSDAKFKATYTFTEEPILLENYIGSAGPSSETVKYYQFGDFPQSILNDDIRLTSRPMEYGYYIGTDGNYYAKVDENGYVLTVTDKIKYSDNTYVGEKQNPPNELYFKVEPIIWRLVTEDYDHDKNPDTPGQALFLCESIITSDIPYCVSAACRKINGNSIMPNNYKYSTIRAYLNGTYEPEDSQPRTYENKGLLQIAFTPDAQELIMNTQVCNKALQMSIDGISGVAIHYECPDTLDKLFLLSELELVSAGRLGFPVYDAYAGNSTKEKRDSSRVRIPTDYAMANNANLSSIEGYGGWWWSRSPSNLHSISARCNRSRGDTDFSTVSLTSGGVVPALVIKL